MASDVFTHRWRTTTWSRVWVALAAGLALALALTLLVPAPTAEASKGCSVKNEATGRTYSTLQAAVKAAKPKATLLVRGTCRGRTVVEKSLTIKGVRDARWGGPVLAGTAPRLPSYDRHAGLEVGRRARVIVSRLLITGGRCHGRPSCSHAAGLLNRGRLTLQDVTVRGNSAVMKGGGIYNHGTLTLSGSTTIAGNKAGWGGGVFNRGLLTMNDRSRIVGNLAHDRYGHDSGGGGVWNDGRVVLNDSSRISGNNVRRGRYETTYSDSGRGGIGGGDGTVVLNDSSRISGNNGAGFAGGVNAYVLVMNDASVVSGNTAGVAAGVWVSSLTMTGSSAIRGNTARHFGGGVYRNRETQTLTGVRCVPEALANVHGNTPDNCVMRAWKY